MYISYYSDICFSDKNKWYYKILKKDVNLFLKPYYDFKNGMNQNSISTISQQLERYCKSENPEINEKLRDSKELKQCDNELIEILDHLINQFKIPENIIVYRGADIDIFGDEYSSYKDLGYLSTSLVKEAVYFAHNKKYLYKISISKGTCGFCPQVFTCRDIEYELILPRNSIFQLVRKRKKKKYIEIVCKLVDEL